MQRAVEDRVSGLGRETGDVCVRAERQQYTGWACNCNPGGMQHGAALPAASTRPGQSSGRFVMCRHESCVPLYAAAALRVCALSARLRKRLVQKPPTPPAFLPARLSVGMPAGPPDPLFLRETNARAPRTWGVMRRLKVTCRQRSPLLVYNILGGGWGVGMGAGAGNGECLQPQQRAL
jgi:hypothetical protein